MKRFFVPVMIFLFSLASPAFGSDANKPHPHQGVGLKFTSPQPITLTETEKADLAAGKSVRKQVKHSTGGRGIAVMDVNASTDKVWAVINDFPSYPNWIKELETIDVYEKSGAHTKVHFVLNVLFMDVEYWIDHTQRPNSNALTWELDYGRHSDLDDSTGYWMVYPSPADPAKSRVEYTVDIRLSGWVPGMVQEMLANKGLEQATTWVKKQAEQ